MGLAMGRIKPGEGLNTLTLAGAESRASFLAFPALFLALKSVETELVKKSAPWHYLLSDNRFTKHNECSLLQQKDTNTLMNLRKEHCKNNSS